MAIDAIGASAGRVDRCVTKSLRFAPVDVAGAIADPVRRAILERLRTGDLTAGAIAAAFPISRPATSRHLRILREQGLVVDAVRGRERVYGLDPRPLAELEAWLASFRGPLAGVAGALDALETEVHRTRRERRGAQPASAPAPTSARSGVHGRTA
jgi:DNA-binding transcriptional ArsR family regulator